MDTINIDKVTSHMSHDTGVVLEPPFVSFTPQSVIRAFQPVIPGLTRNPEKKAKRITSYQLRFKEQYNNPRFMPMKKRSLFQSFSYAVAGFVYALRAERNMKIHMVVAAIATLLGIWVKLSTIEFIFLFITIAMVLMAELLNTCIEVAIDHTTNGEKHPTVKIIKDIGAGAVLVASAAAGIIALLLFVPKMFM